MAANGSWSTTVPAADMAALRDGDASAQVRVTNVNGNSATATHEYSVDSAAPTVTINTIASDNIINASEAAAERNGVRHQHGANRAERSPSRLMALTTRPRCRQTAAGA